MMDDNVTKLRPSPAPAGEASRKPDPTNAERQRRYKERRKAGNGGNGSAVTLPVTLAPTVTTAQMCALASRLAAGAATAADLQMADRLLMELVARLPPDSAVELPDSLHACHRG
jgi:hypothetical protein